MAILKQNENVEAVYLGWYGQCGEPVCEEFDLKSSSNMIAKVFQFTEDGVGTKTFVSDVPDYMNTFTKLVCGTPYYIVLKKGVGQIEISDFAHGFHNEEQKNFGMITRNCTTSFVDNAPLGQDSIEPQVEEKPCTKDVRVCPDGSYVGRDGLMDCNFPPCGFDKDLHMTMKKTWDMNQFNHYKFDFRWSCYCTDEMTQEVTLFVKYGKIYKIVKKQNSEEISLAQNEGIEESPDKKPVPMKYLSMKGLYNWVGTELKKYPFSVSAEYNDDMGYMSGLFIDKVQDIADEEIGFDVTNFELLEVEGKCPPDYKKCKDGTVLKRDPNNDCKFPECPDTPDKTPVSASEPKLEYRWLSEDESQFLQIKNILNPLSSEVSYLGWRTVYGSTETTPTNVDSDLFKHARVGYYYPKVHGEVDEFLDITIGVDDEYKNQLIVMLDENSAFLPQPATLENASHLYIHVDDAETTSQKIEDFPLITRKDVKYVDDVYCTEDVKICPDGSYVSRNPSKGCEFDDCEGEEIVDELDIGVDEELDMGVDEELDMGVDEDNLANENLEDEPSEWVSVMEDNEVDYIDQTPSSDLIDPISGYETPTSDLGGIDPVQDLTPSPLNDDPLMPWNEGDGIDPLPSDETPVPNPFDDLPPLSTPDPVDFIDIGSPDDIDPIIDNDGSYDYNDPIDMADDINDYVDPDSVVDGDDPIDMVDDSDDYIEPIVEDDDYIDPIVEDIDDSNDYVDPIDMVDDSNDSDFPDPIVEDIDDSNDYVDPIDMVDDSNDSDFPDPIVEDIDDSNN